MIGGARDKSFNYYFAFFISSIYFYAFYVTLELILKCVAEVQPNINPMTWFKDNTKDYPILSRFWLAYSSFPETSCNAERVFNLDGLIITKFAQHLTLK